MPKKTTKKPLDLLGLMQLANDAYGDGGLEDYFDPQTGEPIKRDHIDKHGHYWRMLPDGGDLLAAYVVADLHDAAHDPDGVLSKHTVLQGAIYQLETAIHDLQRVRDALEEELEHD